MRYVLSRIASTIPTLLLIALASFVLVRVIPGDPVHVMFGEIPNPEAAAQMRERLGLDKPLIVQAQIYLRDLIQGDIGVSIRTRRPVLAEIGTVFPYTLVLAVAASVLAVVIAVPIGVYAALHRGRIGDMITMALAVLGRAMPNFWLGILLLLVFSLGLGWFPAIGSGDWSDPGSVLQALVLPAIALAVAEAAFLARITRSGLLDELPEDYVRTAKAKGMGRRTVLYGHALRNALIPLVTVVGLSFGRLVTGAVVVEVVFSRPGLGTLLVSAINNRDYALIQGAILVFAVLLVVTNLLTDFAYGLVDPRIRRG
jgi:ABC-type dipeptide/oligopeptide/nickel transport system permease component